jgi:hypothetical protein
MPKRLPIIGSFIIGLALTVYGTYAFLNIKSGYHQTVAPSNQQVIQLGLAEKQMMSTPPAWTLSKQTSVMDVPARTQVKIRVGPTLSIETYKAQNDVGHFFIAGIIVENQSDNSEEKTIFIDDDQPQVADVSYAHPSDSDLAIN